MNMNRGVNNTYHAACVDNLFGLEGSKDYQRPQILTEYQHFCQQHPSVIDSECFNKQ